MKAMSLVVLCVAVAAASASWHGGLAIVAPGAHGGALGGVTHGSAVISGPAGSISTHGNGAWGGHGAWGGVGGVWNGGWAGGWAGAGLAGSGHEGQWVPDGTEHLYDDGSYRPEHHYGGGHGVHGVHGGHW